LNRLRKTKKATSVAISGIWNKTNAWFYIII
jgi:hypothetical protein